LSLDLTPSIYLQYFIFTIHLLALGVLTLDLDIHVGILFVLGVIVLISLYRSLENNNSIRFKRYIIKIHFLKDKQWKLTYSDQESSVAELQDNYLLLPYLQILYFKQKRKDNVIILLPDMINKDEIRRLKLHLRTNVT
jgi:hypothetical protein